MELLGALLFWAIFIVLKVWFIPCKKDVSTDPLTIVKTNATPLHDDFLPSHRSNAVTPEIISMAELHTKVISLENEIKQLKQDIDC